MADQLENISKLGIVSTTLKAILAASARAVVSPFKGDNGAPKWYKDVVFAMMRTQLGNLNLAQDRYLNSQTTPTYLKFAKQVGFAPDSITLPSGTQAHWLGNKNAKKLLLFFHGGGYVLPATDGHMKILLEINETLAAQGTDTAALLLAYDLAPEAAYPTQLRQGVEVLRHLVETEKRDPANITLGGDSAGGNLALGVLSHLAHPHPDIPALSLPSKLHATFLISPWASFNTHTASFKTNSEKDMFDARTLNRWSSAFLGSDSPFAGDFYSEPVLAPASWWEKTADVIDEVLIWGGGNEILIDGIEEFARRFTKGFSGKGGKVTTVVTPKAAHDEWLAEKLLGYNGDSGTGSSTVLKDWVKARL